MGNLTRHLVCSDGLITFAPMMEYILYALLLVLGVLLERYTRHQK